MCYVAGTVLDSGAADRREQAVHPDFCPSSFSSLHSSFPLALVYFLLNSFPPSHLLSFLLLFSLPPLLPSSSLPFLPSSLLSILSFLLLFPLPFCFPSLFSPFPSLTSVILENNQAPVAVAGPDKELFFPVQSATLDGSGSSDDHGIVCYHWEHIR